MTRCGQITLRCWSDVLQRCEECDGVVSLAFRKRSRGGALNEAERSAIRRDTPGVDADSRCDPATKCAKQGAVAAPDVEDMSARRDVWRCRAYAPGLQDRIASSDLSSKSFRFNRQARSGYTHGDHRPGSRSASSTMVRRSKRLERPDCNASERRLCRALLRAVAGGDSAQGEGMHTGHASS